MLVYFAALTVRHQTKRFLSHPAADQPLIHWQQWTSLTLSVCGFWMWTFEYFTHSGFSQKTTLYYITQGVFDIHIDTSRVLQCIPLPSNLFLNSSKLMFSITNFSSSHTFVDRFRWNPCSLSCCCLPLQFLIPSPAQNTSLCWSRLVYAH